MGLMSTEPLRWTNTRLHVPLLGFWRYDGFYAIDAICNEG